MQRRNQRHSSTISHLIGRIIRQNVRFIVEPFGATRFRVKQVYPASSRSGTIYTVCIGSAQLCTCGSPDICVHILYVMLRYFRVPKSSGLLYKRTLSDDEVESILETRYIGVRNFPHFGYDQNENAPQTKEDEIKPTKKRDKVSRLPINDDDICPICYDSLKDSPKEDVAWCAYGCGGNFHLSCVLEWIKSRNADQKHGTCPLCRIEMDEPETSEDEIAKPVEIRSSSISQTKVEARDHSETESRRYNSQDFPYNPNESYLAQLRRELENENSQRNAQQRIQNDNVSNDNNPEIQEDQHLSERINQLSSQINEIDEFIIAARNELNREVLKLREHQRRAQASIQSQMRAQVQRDLFRDSNGIVVEPVLKVRLPVFDNNFHQPPTLHRPMPSLSSNTLNAELRVSNETNNKNISIPSPPALISTFVSSQAMQPAIQECDNDPSSLSTPNRNNNISFPNLGAQNNCDHSAFESMEANNNEILSSSGSDIALEPNPDFHAVIQSSSTQNEIILNNNHETEESSNIASNELGRSISYDLHSNVQSNIQVEPNNSDKDEKSIDSSSSNSKQIRFYNSTPLLQSVNNQINSDFSTQDTTYSLNKTMINSLKPTKEETSSSIKQQNQNYKSNDSLLSNKENIRLSPPSNKRLSMIQSPEKNYRRAQEMNLVLPKGNITDGLTLYKRQAYENDIHMQRALSPQLTIRSKRHAYSRIQQKSSKTMNLLGWTS